MLTDNSAVFACGLNEDKQLGVRDAGDKLAVFREVVTLRDLNVSGLVRVIARDFHSIAYSEQCIYIWGTNYGQMGIDVDVKSVPLPKQVNTNNFKLMFLIIFKLFSDETTIKN